MKFNVIQFLSAHVYMMNAQDLSFRRTRKKPFFLVGSSYRGQEVLDITNMSMSQLKYLT